MIKLIKNLIGGILGFVTGLLPGKKKDGGYYLQLDESGEVVEPTPKAVEAAQPAAATNGTKATAQPAEETPAPVAQTEPQPEKKPALATKAVKAKASKNGKVEPAEPAKAPAAVAAVKKEPTETTFAPKYLIPTSTNGRRRPGANMSSFLDMASQVKTPSQAQ
ncbi:hypothetical protein H6G69_06925 [Nostoc sp. FACHB-110]|nr:hypothetical protein [Nostoc sp. FACHB-110]MBD2436537.1 hypothetical protein [Nostoc sp. FACHB-110]